MKRFLLFYGGDAEFGFDAFIGSFETLEEVVCELIAKSKDPSIPWQNEDINWQVVDRNNSKVLADRTDGFPGRPGKIEDSEMTATVRAVLLRHATQT